MPPCEIEKRISELAVAVAETDLTFATAESCTGGQLAALLAGDVKLGSHLERGFVVYSEDAKCELLGVEREYVEQSDAVNPEVARAMATGALTRSHADIAISVTGYCGPQQADEEVGLVYLACASRTGVLIQQECHFGDMGRKHVLDHAVVAALGLMIEVASAPDHIGFVLARSH